MASSSLVQRLAGLRCAPLSPSPSRACGGGLSPTAAPRPGRAAPSPASWVAKAVVCGTYPVTEAQKERKRLRDLFEEAAERCITEPMEGVEFTLEEFHAAIENMEYNFEIGIKVKGTVYMTDFDGAFVEIGARSTSFLPTDEASMYRLKHVSEGGIYPGLVDEFMIVDERENDGCFILSSRVIQYELAWERCRQLQAEDVIVKGKVVGGNKGGLVVEVEGIRGFVPFSQMSSKLSADELLNQELPLKFIEVDEEQSRIVLSNRKATADSQAQLGIGSVVLGTVESIKPYGAFIDIGGTNGLLHVSQISHDRVSDISSVLQPGDTLKVMILSHDRERGRISLSTKKLEPTPGDMMRNPKLVFEKADEMAQIFRQRIAQAEAMARADMLRFQPEQGGLGLNSDGLFTSLLSNSNSNELTPRGNTDELQPSDAQPADE